MADGQAPAGGPIEVFATGSTHAVTGEPIEVFATGSTHAVTGEPIEVFATGSTHAVTGEPIEVFATGSTHAVTGEPQVLADVIRRGVSTVRDGYEHARDFQARAGRRPGTTIADVSPRRTGPADVVRPVLVNPVDACRVAVSGRLFDEPLPGLRIEPQSADVDDLRYLVWNAVLDVDHHRCLPASLHLLGSPSMVVTVLELVPRRRLRLHRQTFVRHGLTAIDALAARLGRITGGDARYEVAGTTPDAQIA